MGTKSEVNRKDTTLRILFRGRILPLNDQSLGNSIVPSKTFWIEKRPEETQTKAAQRNSITETTQASFTKVDGIALKIHDLQFLVIHTQSLVAKSGKQIDISRKNQKSNQAHANEGGPREKHEVNRRNIQSASLLNPRAQNSQRKVPCAEHRVQ